jgi:mRNA (guanine-N7-)-methyltransferase
MSAKEFYDHAAANESVDPRARALRDFHNHIKKLLYWEFAHHAPRLLDIACGKGGDLHKWKHSKIQYVRGIDISSKSIDQARERLSKMKTEMRVDLECMPAQNFRDHANLYDAVSCMFALHYFFESEALLRQIIQVVASSLKTNGVFFGCVPHGIQVLKSLNERVSMKSSAMEIKRDLTEPECFGSAYEISIFGTVIEGESREFLVFQNVLVAICEEYNLIGVSHFSENFTSSIHLEDSGVFKHFKPGADFDAEQAEASGIFCVFAFRKK